MGAISIGFPGSSCPSVLSHTNTMLSFKISGLTASWGNNTILAGVDLSFTGGGCLVPVMGPSGGGKSTLLYHLAGLKWPDRGEVSWSFGDGDRLSWGKRGLDGQTARRLRTEHFSFVFQDSTMSDHLRVVENLCYPLQLQGATRKESLRRVTAALEEVLASDDTYASLELVDIVYGNDQSEDSYNQALALVDKYPDLKLIIRTRSASRRLTSRTCSRGSTEHCGARGGPRAT